MSEALKKLNIIIEIDEAGHINLKIPPSLPLAYMIGVLELSKDILINGTIQPATEVSSSDTESIITSEGAQ